MLFAVCVSVLSVQLLEELRLAAHEQKVRVLLCVGSLVGGAVLSFCALLVLFMQHCVSSCQPSMCTFEKECFHALILYRC